MFEVEIKTVTLSLGAFDGERLVSRSCDDLGYLARKVASRWHRLPGPQGGAVVVAAPPAPQIGKKGPFLVCTRGYDLKDLNALFRLPLAVVLARHRLSAYSGTPVVAAPSLPVIAVGAAAVFGTRQKKKKPSKSRSSSFWLATCACMFVTLVSSRWTFRHRTLNGSAAEAVPTSDTVTSDAQIAMATIAFFTFHLLSVPSRR